MSRCDGKQNKLMASRFHFHLTEYDINKSIKTNAIVHRFRVETRHEDGYYFGEIETMKALGQRQQEFDVCLYVGYENLSLRSIKAIMGKIVWENYEIERVDCLGFCQDFVMMYFDIFKKPLSSNHEIMLERLTLTNPTAAISECCEGQNPTRSWSLGSDFLGTIIGGVVTIGVASYVLRTVKKESGWLEALRQLPTLFHIVFSQGHLW